MQVLAIRLDLEAMALAAFDDFARPRIIAEQTKQVRSGADGGAVFLNLVAGLATHLREQFLAERDEILELLLVGVAAGLLWQFDLGEVRGPMARVAHGNWP